MKGGPYLKRKLSVSFDDTSKMLLADPEMAALYLEECLLGGDIELFKLALKHVADARPGGMTRLAKRTALTREALYRSLSKKGNPRLDTLTKVLDVFGLRIGVSVKDHAVACR
ncbi:MAG: putative addiction module antidote protein [Alphaproteobacteria bacterium]|nr:putative addiction module antidote protein [Alphaproteobacteria bacterium]